MWGLRQGDPLSPYLFTLVMEVLNLMIKRNVSMNPQFKYHWQCKDLKLTHLCFADDLMLFCHGDSKSVDVLKKAIDEFGSVSGLFPSFPKSTVFFGNVKDFSKAKILEVMPFVEGKLPVRYLGVPLLSKRLYVNDCLPLIDKVKKRILDWKNKMLSFAGRLQLIKSVLGSMQVYWSSMFILPITISNEVERIMRDFLWNFGVFKKGKARIRWSDVCKLKIEGGLGIKSLESWNIALISKHIWNIICKKDSLWVKWVHIYKLRGRNFWDAPEREGSSWSWKKILKIRCKLRSHIVHRIGNGLNSSLWFDNWHAICPLSDFISKRKIFKSGLPLDCKVAYVIEDGMWKWPDVLSVEFDGLKVIDPPCLIEDKLDKVFWRSKTGRFLDFSVGVVWNDLRVCSDVVPWAKLVWFSQNIPRHAFLMWLAVHGRLRTQDLMGVWDKNDGLRCVFCKMVPDSHNHLFFECEFPRKIWYSLKDLVRLDHAPFSWSHIIEFMLKRPINKSIWSILQRLLLGASIYFVWQERNLRMFQNKERPMDVLVNMIKESVRLRVMSLSLNYSAQVEDAAILWNFHVKRDMGCKKAHFHV
ncbi:putative RNA-directed DNA polymerase [Tanacetum coccineum]